MRFDEGLQSRVTAAAANHQKPALHVLVALLRDLEAQRHNYFTSGYRVDIEGPEDAEDPVEGLQQALTQVMKANGKVRRGTFDVEPIKRWFSTTTIPDLDGLHQTRLLARALDRFLASRTRGLWEHLEEYYGDRLVEHACIVEAGDPLPVFKPPFRLGSKAVETHPKRLPRRRTPARTTNVMLVPASTSRIRLQLNLGLRTELRELSADTARSLRLATIHPFDSLDHIEPHAAEDDLTFGPVVPRAGTIDLIVRGIEVACENDAHIVVLPELCAAEDDQDAIAEAWARHNRGRKAILVAGSYHERPQVGHGRNASNRARIYGAGAAPVATIDKRVPFIWGRSWRTDLERYVDELPLADRPVDSQTKKLIVRHDFLERVRYRSEPTLELFFSEEASLAVVICADFLDDEVRDHLRDLDISVVLIPSMSEKARIFERLIIGHVAATQSVVAYVNAVFSDKRERPEEPDASKSSRGYVRRSGLTPERWQLDATFSTDIDAPGVGIIDLYDDTRRWIALQAAEEGTD